MRISFVLCDFHLTMNLQTEELLSRFIDNENSWWLKSQKHHHCNPTCVSGWCWNMCMQSHTDTSVQPLQDSWLPKLTVADRTRWLCHVYSLCSDCRRRRAKSWRKPAETWGRITSSGAGGLRPNPASPRLQTWSKNSYRGETDWLIHGFQTTSLIHCSCTVQTSLPINALTKLFILSGGLRNTDNSTLHSATIIEQEIIKQPLNMRD